MGTVLKTITTMKVLVFVAFAAATVVAMPEADANPNADPYRVYSGAAIPGYYSVGYPLGGGYNGVYPHYSHNYGHGYVHRLGKREAEAQPEAEADADALVGYNAYIATGVLPTDIRTSPVLPA